MAVVSGGKSAEHEVSLRSAKNVAAAMDKSKYEVVPVKIGKTGQWPIRGSWEKFFSSIDVVFPILHGPFGEDGTVQGLLKIIGVPFVGAGVLGSAVGMDKDVMKRLLRQASIPVGKFMVFKSGEKISFVRVRRGLGLPLFVKPANMGSSVGVSKAVDELSLAKAIKTAFKFDTKIIIEEFIAGRELECAVLGNDEPIVSVPGEVLVKGGFYSYEAKYSSASEAVTEIPAKVPQKIVKEIQKLAVKTFTTLCGEGLARVDFFLKNDGRIYVNEINTMPGFTNISMYPKLWAESGISYSHLIDRLIQLALAHTKAEKKLRISI